MDRTQKQSLVDTLQQVFADTVCVVVTHQAGLNVAEATQLRRQVRSAGAGFRVTKNRLARRALAGTAFEPLSGLFTGPTAIAFSRDPVAAAKVVVEFANRNDKLTIVGGGLAGRQMDAAGVRELASLPSLDELRSKLVGLLRTPATLLAVVSQATAGQIVRVLAAFAERQDEAA
ncbi:MAG: 50S ribosomal protein L10 [Alphaproteobacteria bacterium]|nr:50S ribosomal protein L10 [Alphaproteobacteria bacterium]